MPPTWETLMNLLVSKEGAGRGIEFSVADDPARIQQMPIYEYNCRKCDSKFEKLVKNAAHADDAVCPSCGSKNTARALSVFAAVSSAGENRRHCRRECADDAAGPDRVRW